MIKNILCDLDGVLSDFLSLALEKLAANEDTAPLTPTSAKDYARFGHFDIAEIYGISMTKFWDTLEKGDNFWCNLKPFPWAQDLLAWLETIAPVTICTSPSLHPVCAKQKIEWVEKHLSRKNTHLMIGTRKYLMAKPENLMIDDYEKNIDAFRSNGGYAIKVPSNWNTYPLTFETVKIVIERELFRLKYPEFSQLEATKTL